MTIIPALTLADDTMQPERVGNHATPSTARNPAPVTPTIRSQTNLVLVPVSVRDASGKPVADLQINDFVVTEEGEAIRLDYLGQPELTRLEIVLVFDLTSSVWYYFDLVKEAASGFVRSLYRPGDAVSVVGISSEPLVLLKRTESLPAVLEGLNGIRRSGAATAFYDTVAAAARLFPQKADPETRRVLVVLSDGEDNFSRMNLEKTLQLMHEADCLFYSINPGATERRLNIVSRRGQQQMETLAEHTGGRAFLVEGYQNLNSVYSRIAEELQVQYLLGYNSPDASTDGSYRPISVALPGHPKLKVHARKGYYTRKTAQP